MFVLLRSPPFKKEARCETFRGATPATSRRPFHQLGWKPLMCCIMKPRQRATQQISFRINTKHTVARVPGLQRGGLCLIRLPHMTVIPAHRDIYLFGSALFSPLLQSLPNGAGEAAVKWLYSTITCNFSSYLQGGGGYIQYKSLIYVSALVRSRCKFPYTLGNARYIGTRLIASSVGFMSDARLGGRQGGERRCRFGRRGRCVREKIIFREVRKLRSYEIQEWPHGPLWREPLTPFLFRELKEWEKLELFSGRMSLASI